MNTNKPINLTMLCDFYELTMGNGYLQHGYRDRITYYDMFFRRVPDGGGFAIAAGLEQVIDYINELHFSEEDIAYLRGRKLFERGISGLSAALQASPATSGPCPRAPRSSPRSRW